MQPSVVVSWGPKLKEVENSYPGKYVKVPMTVVLAMNSKNADTSRREGNIYTTIHGWHHGRDERVG